MKSSRSIWFSLIPLILLPAVPILVIWLIVHNPEPTSTSSSNALDAAAILAVVGFTSLVIERVLEFFWNIVDVSGSAFWPLNVIGIVISGLVMGLGSSPAHEIIQAINDWRQSQGLGTQQGQSGNSKGGGQMAAFTARR